MAKVLIIGNPVSDIMIHYFVQMGYIVTQLAKDL